MYSCGKGKMPAWKKSLSRILHALNIGRSSCDSPAQVAHYCLTEQTRNFCFRVESVFVLGTNRRHAWVTPCKTFRHYSSCATGSLGVYIPSLRCMYLECSQKLSSLTSSSSPGWSGACTAKPCMAVEGTHT